MFKRVERKRKRREEEEEMGLDQNTREIMGLNDTDSDESDSGSEHESVGSDANIDQEGVLGPEDESAGEEHPISVAEALKDPVYLISLDPDVHGCVLCKGKLIKNTSMAITHKNANSHKRRFEHFKQLSVDVDPRSNAWVLVRAIHTASDLQRAESQELSKRALKRQVKQAAIRDKRKRHKELKAKAIAKKTLKKLPSLDETTPAGTPPRANDRSPPNSQRKIQKKKKLGSDTATTITKTRNAIAKPVLRVKTSSDKKERLGKRAKRAGKSS